MEISGRKPFIEQVFSCTSKVKFSNSKFSTSQIETCSLTFTAQLRPPLTCKTMLLAGHSGSPW